uniref:Urea active transporter n=1 Tax=Chlamydomonas leiostraca TaxID=1034604 RepID=A0A7S0S4D6_9CHLO|mmetsp:Transcript_6648/g.16508  ORF Transcript_6648/g.16508 Transcript_6648/m.16508 type:complete len:693 (+) Transcript_6648:179-2257(+)|eukprot:CAMPEP_0202862104 /NCGR_PEP_ID=MMETSP1391-20130828/3266_1 /ASSEMBLY_ACC=CAM_ASM_000867 /TAXON_ID=1034604 /ORGANISM="Chlamydomonas leiostraca, Strain SAG 11-49" /LENGTH=692 /DNA_ID=CAMNT_0049541595 /DNA_START=137 /DNA_END=2215 /DNA_ORIENTATION=-
MSQENYCSFARIAARQTDNQFGITKYDGQCSFFGSDVPLPEGLGWFIVVGLGAIFTVFSTVLMWVDRKYGGVQDDELDFNTAGRSVKTGLVACDIVSKWTWAATLLQSSNVAFKYGVSGPLWYAAGATIQVLLFAILAVEVKRKAPNIHTVLEIIKCRWGRAAHIVFLFFCLATNVIVTSMLILGGAAVINALTGVDLYAASFLIPISVVYYTAMGGLRATFIASWCHVAVIYLALCIFTLTIYGTDADLGSPAQVYRNLRVMERVVPVKDNRGGSYVTMFSKSGIIFGIINIIGNFGTVFVDQAYWQSAIAARPSATYKGYLLGGLCWFAVPFTMATSLGLAGRALDLPINLAEAEEGLVPPAVATHLMGKGGAFLITFQVFMAITSSASAEQIAVSSLIAFDVYREYINPKATPRQILVLSRVMVGIWAVLSGVCAVILFQFELALGWVYLFMGVIIGSAVFPVAAAIMWKKCSARAAIISSVAGLCLAVMTWLITAAKLNDGEVSVATTGQDYPMLAGNLVALVFGSILCIVLTYIWPDDFDWDRLRQLDKDYERRHVLGAHSPGHMEPDINLDEALVWTCKVGSALAFLLIVAWPVLALAAGIFPETYFTFWVIVAIVWGLCATLCCILLPVWDARATVWNLLHHRPVIQDHGKKHGSASSELSERLVMPGSNRTAATNDSLAVPIRA